MYKLCIDLKQWKDCPDSTEEDVLYVARTLSKFSRCRVDVYKFDHKQWLKVMSYVRGQVFRKENVA